MFLDKNEKDQYIKGIWEKVETKYLTFYPFLMDHEFRDLFGRKVLDALDSLRCPQEDCGLCDIDIDCPYYSRHLDRCGVARYKPVHCRLWHCYECGPEPIVKHVRELTAVFADQLGPEAEAEEIKEALERGDISAETARKQFEKLIEIFRNEQAQA